MSWGPAPHQVLDILRAEAPNPVSCTEIAERTGETWEHTNHALVTLKRTGQVERILRPNELPRTVWGLPA